jgi:hypothetical protein
LRLSELFGKTVSHRGAVVGPFAWLARDKPVFARCFQVEVLGKRIAWPAFGARAGVARAGSPESPFK